MIDYEGITLKHIDDNPQLIFICDGDKKQVEIRKNKYLTEQDKKFQLMSNVYQQNKFECKHCGHKQVIPADMKKHLCSWCNNYVFRNEKDEFEYRVKEKLKR